MYLFMRCGLTAIFASDLEVANTMRISCFLYTIKEPGCIILLQLIHTCYRFTILKTAKKTHVGGVGIS